MHIAAPSRASKVVSLRSMSWRTSFSVVVLVLAGCPGGGDATGPTAPIGRPASGVDRDPVTAPAPLEPAPQAPPPASDVSAPPVAPAAPVAPAEPVAPVEPRPPALRRASTHGLRLAPVSASQGEDGRGNVVPATRAFALDAVADAWPVRALDPVLYVGELHFHQYTFTSPGVLRFIVADVGALPSGAQVFVQYGSDDGSRVVLERSLRMP